MSSEQLGGPDEALIQRSVSGGQYDELFDGVAVVDQKNGDEPKMELDGILAAGPTSPAGSDPPTKAASSRKVSLSGTRRTENGFAVMRELLTLVVQDSYIAPFSLPEEALSFEAKDSDIMARFRNGDAERMIFCNTPLTDQEQRWLATCRREAERLQLVLLPSLTVAAGRFLGDVHGDHHVALKRMLEAQAWRLEYFRNGPIRDLDIVEDMKYGILYFCGRDRSLRPALVVRPGRIPRELVRQRCADRFNKLFLFCMDYFLRYMVVPGKVENVCIILDLKDVSPRQVPLQALMEIKTVLSMQHAGRVFRFYICNMPLVLNVLSVAVKAAMTERQRQKIVFVRKMEELHKEFALHHLEQDLGGTRPRITQFLPFPLLPGPFEPGFSQGPRTDAVAGLHQRMTEEAARGRLWDPTKSAEENSSVALLPPGVVAPRDSRYENLASPHAIMDTRGSNGSPDGYAANTLGNATRVASLSRVPELGGTLVQEEAVKPAGRFSCTCQCRA